MKSYFWSSILGQSGAGCTLPKVSLLGECHKELPIEALLRPTLGTHLCQPIEGSHPPFLDQRAAAGPRGTKEKESIDPTRP